MSDTRDISLSYGQRALWFVQKLAPGAAAYNVSLPARARHLDAAAFRAAWQALADRHPVLRTTYPAPGGLPVGRVHERFPVDFSEVDATAWSAEELDRRLAEEAHRPFRLEEGPVVRLRLFHRPDGETIALSSLHHISIDFSSLAVLLDELGALYDAAREGRSAVLPPVAATYESFARWQTTMLGGPRGIELEALWRNRLAGAPAVLDLPTDHPRPQKQTFRGGSLDVLLPEDLTRGARDLAAAEGVDLGVLMLAAFLALLHRYTGQDDVLVGCPVPGRPAAELREVVGYFVNSVVVRGDLSGAPSFRDALIRVRQRVDEARAWQDYPFPLLVERLRPQRDPGVTPVFQVFFVLYQGEEERAVRLLTGQSGAVLRTGSLELEPYPLGSRAAMFDLALLMGDAGDRVAASFQFNADLFEPATVTRVADDYAELLAAVLADPDRPVAALPASLGEARRSVPESPASHENAIAILAMAGRFPGARDLDGFWQNLRQGVESIRTLPDEELLAAGVLPATLADPRYVRAAGVVEEIDLFDAPFFGYSAGEAALLDPQQRLFLECAWEALEAAGYDGQRIDGPVGVYGGASANSYYFYYLFSRHDLLNAPAAAQGFLGSDKDFLCARTSYELGLRGPSVGVQTACSTSLVAVHLACQSLLAGECNMALAGGVSLRVPQVGYFHLPGGILAPDGHCRAFDAGAAGAVPGNGVGVVVLKRLEDALADGDPIRAVIRGSAVTNDGALRVGFSAPGVEGQSAAIAEALAMARVDPASIGYVEAHGSGTALGDPIEIAALTRAFRTGTERRGFCAVGSVKTNIGHLDAAAGVAGLIKTVLALEHREIPPSLHFRTPNPNIDFAASPFYVNAALVPWEADGAPRRAGVSSFGLGGTNVHVVLEEAPEPEPSGPSRPWQLLVLSAATPTALESATDRLAAHLEEHPEQPLPDIAWTLQAGRRVMPWRRAVVCRDAEEARRSLAAREPAFREEIDACADLTRLGRLWLSGEAVDWEGFRGEERRRRVALPAYPFERKRYWVEVGVEDGVKDGIEEGVASPPPGGMVATTIHARPGLFNPYVAPATPVEEKLAGIWQELLGVSPVGVHDRFFDLGGHSLMASQLLARIAAGFGVELPLAALFEEPTVAGLAARLPGGEIPVAEPALPRRPRPDRAPLSFAQQRLWFIDRLAPGSAAYNNPVAMRLRGPLDIDVLRAALTEIHRRHEILRTTFPFEDDEPVQRIGEPEPAVIDRIDPQDAWRAVAVPFDLAVRPPVRHLLARLGEDDHLFVTAMHHILWDEWSQGIFVRELAALYDAYREDRPSPLPELPLQYGDWAAWQRETLRGEVLEGHLAWWRDRLEGAPRLLALPTDRPRPAVQSFRGATRGFAVSGELQRTLHDLAQRRGITLFMTLLAAFQALLGRYSGQDDLVVATGTGGRGRVEAESLIGCFINIVLLRADLAAPASFGELLDRTRESTLDAFAHQDLPFELLVGALEVERDPSSPPLAQVMLVFLNLPPLDVHLGGDLEAEGVRIDRESAQLDLCLYLGEEGGRLGGHLEYNTDLFDAATVDRLLGHYRNLLERAAADPSLRTAEIPLLSTAERRQVVEEWNATAVDFPRDACVHELFEARAAEAPNAVALVCGEASLTYAELERRANALAHHLIRLGACRGGRIGVSLERAPEVAVSLLAVLEAGCAYVPLDPRYPQERLAAMLDCADVHLLVTQERLADRFAGFDVRPVLVDNWAEERARPPSTGVSPEDLVYVIFTSGSTGHPKGVMLDHRGRVNNFTDFNRRFRMGPGDAVLNVSSPSFDITAYDILGTLAAGGTIVMPRPEKQLEPAEWARLLELHRVTLWHSAPALLEMLVSWLEAWPEAARPRLSSLRLVLLGGDWIPLTLPDRLRALAPGARVVSLGGATEASVHSTIHPIGEVDPAWKSIPYGVPLANQLAYVAGPQGEPSPVGMAGELLLGGIGVGRGYFGRPDLTAERFVPDPFSAEPGRRLYRTGDLARYRSDGVLELLGRMDQQVKIHGFRIEPGEIAAILRQHPAVAELVVVARDDRPGDRGKRIVAYLVPAPGREIDVQEIRDLARRRLPGYMVPSAFVVLQSLPLTPNRKLDRKALPAPAEERPEEGRLLPPRTAVEKFLAEIWKTVLGRAGVGALDSFFDLGGDSLAATRVVTQIQDVFPLEVPLRTLFEAPTLAELAACLEDMGAAAGVDVTGIAEAVLEVQDLRDDEVRKLLARKAAP